MKEYQGPIALITIGGFWFLWGWIISKDEDSKKTLMGMGSILLFIALIQIIIQANKK